MTDCAFCLYTNPSRATIPLIRPHQCDSEGGRIRGVLLYQCPPHQKSVCYASSLITPLSPLEEVLITPVAVLPHCPLREEEACLLCQQPYRPITPVVVSPHYASSRIAPLSAPSRRSLFAGNTAMVVRTPGNVSDLSFVLMKFTWKQHNGMSPKQFLTRTPGRPFRREMNSSSKHTYMKWNSQHVIILEIPNIFSNDSAIFLSTSLSNKTECAHFSTSL